MNYNYRKKSLEVQAFQMTEERMCNKLDWPKWLNQVWGTVLIGITDPRKPLTLTISVPTGWLLEVSPNYWIVQGQGGELIIIQPNIFEATYEAA